MTSESPHISIVVPVLNGARFIRPCIESVLDQTCEDWELFIVDDGSTDDTRDIVAEYCGTDQRIRLLVHPNNANRGVSFSRKLGFSAAKGTHIALLDADDLFEPQKLEIQCQSLEDHPDVVLCHSGISVFGGPDTENFENQINDFCEQTITYQYQRRDHFLRRNGICNSTVMMRRSSLATIGYGFPQLFQYEDWTLWTLLCEQGPFLFNTDRLTQYRIHADSATSIVSSSRLKRAYSHVEFLLSVIAHADSAETVQAAEAILAERLSKITRIYSPSSFAKSPLADDTQVPGISAAQIWKHRALTAEAKIAALKNPLNFLGQLFRSR